jgi:hypothetical protein
MVSSQPLSVPRRAGASSLAVRVLGARHPSQDENTRRLARIALPRSQRWRGKLLSRIPNLALRTYSKAAVRLCGQVLLWTPLVAVLAASLLALLVVAVSYALIFGLMLRLRLADMDEQFAHLDVAGRVLLASAGYLLALLALRLLVVGLLAAGWRRLWQVIGLIVAVPSLWLLGAGIELVTDAGPLALLPDWIMRLLVVVLLVHAVVFTVVTTDRRPVRAPIPYLAPEVLDAHDTPDIEMLRPVETLATERLPIIRFLPLGTASDPEAAVQRDVRVPGLLHFFSHPESDAHVPAPHRMARRP